MEASRSGRERRDRLLQVGRERRDATAARQRIADERDPAERRHVRTSEMPVDWSNDRWLAQRLQQANGGVLDGHMLS